MIVKKTLKDSFELGFNRTQWLFFYKIFKVSLLQWGKDNPNWRGGLKKFKCFNCGKEFSAYSSLHKKYCSKKCFHSFIKIKKLPHRKQNLSEKAKEHRRQYFKKWQIRNIEKVRKNARKHYYLYKDEINRKRRKLRKINPQIKIKAQVYAHNRRRTERISGILSKEIVQRVYEDNIKRYGTLTCYLCLKSIKFGEDCLEHKIPLSRNGNNEYSNLAIAHNFCNLSKGCKTIKEYREFCNVDKTLQEKR